jgi:hypothetical protein
LPIRSNGYRKAVAETTPTATAKTRNRSIDTVIVFPAQNQNAKNGDTQRSGSRIEAAKTLAFPIWVVEDRTINRSIIAAEKPKRQNLSHQF